MIHVHVEDAMRPRSLTREIFPCRIIFLRTLSISAYLVHLLEYGVKTSQNTLAVHSMGVAYVISAVIALISVAVVAVALAFTKEVKSKTILKHEVVHDACDLIHAPRNQSVLDP